MTAFTSAILALADTAVDGGREAFLKDLAPLLRDERMVSAETLAKMWEVSVGTIRNWTKRGLLKPEINLDGHGIVRFSFAELDRAKKRMNKNAVAEAVEA